MSMRDDDGLDALIDRVARDMTAGDPPASLAEGVRARIAPRRRSGRPERESKGGGRDRAPWFVAWRPLAAAAAVMVTIVTAAALWPEQPAEPPVVAVQRPANVNGGSASASAKATADKPRNPPYVAEGPVGRVPRSGPAGRSEPSDAVALETTTAGPALPPIEPLAVSPIDDPVLVAEMSGLAMPIEIEPLQIAPLDVLTGSGAGL